LVGVISWIVLSFLNNKNDPRRNYEKRVSSGFIRASFYKRPKPFKKETR
jgi:hypothetical protein